VKAAPARVQESQEGPRGHGSGRQEIWNIPIMATLFSTAGLRLESCRPLAEAGIGRRPPAAVEVRRPAREAVLAVARLEQAGVRQVSFA